LPAAQLRAGSLKGYRLEQGGRHRPPCSFVAARFIGRFTYNPLSSRERGWGEGVTFMVWTSRGPLAPLTPAQWGLRPPCNPARPLSPGAHWITKASLLKPPEGLWVGQGPPLSGRCFIAYGKVNRPRRAPCGAMRKPCGWSRYDTATVMAPAGINKRLEAPAVAAAKRRNSLRARSSN